MVRRAIGVVLVLAAWVGLYAAGEMRFARGQELPGRGPKLGDCIHFVLYYSDPVPNDTNIIGHCRSGLVCLLHEDDGSIDLNYMTGRQPNEPDNPPDFWEHKIRRHHAWPPEVGENGTWHYCREHEEVLP